MKQKIIKILKVVVPILIIAALVFGDRYFVNKNQKDSDEHLEQVLDKSHEVLDVIDEALDNLKNENSDFKNNNSSLREKLELAKESIEDLQSTNKISVDKVELYKTLKNQLDAELDIMEVHNKELVDRVKRLVKIIDTLEKTNEILASPDTVIVPIYDTIHVVVPDTTEITDKSLLRRIKKHLDRKNGNN